LGDTKIYSGIVNKIQVNSLQKITKFRKIEAPEKGLQNTGVPEKEKYKRFREGFIKSPNPPNPKTPRFPQKIKLILERFSIEKCIYDVKITGEK